MAYTVHPIDQIEGVGASRADVLRSVNIFCTEDLLLRSEDFLRNMLSRRGHFPAANVFEYRCAAELMQVKGLTGQFAEALIRAKRQTLVEFAGLSPDTLVEIFDNAKNGRIIPETIDGKKAVSWQKRALTVAYTGTVSGTVIHESVPVNDAKVTCQFEDAYTDERGRFWIPVVPYGINRIIIRKDGFKSFSAKIKVDPGRITTLEVKVSPGQDKIVISEEKKGEPLPLIRAGDEIVFKDVDFTSFENGTPLVLRYRYKNEDIKLISVHRKRIGNVIERLRTRTEGSKVEANAPIGQLFIWQNNELVKSDKTVRDFREEIITTFYRLRGMKVSLKSRRY
ncbi:MAG: DUF4332 domain-containing protein [Desulfobacteraceae bacterium]|nr:DUF4332 domain-containing protein [Desulfobacteraceae bacterium]